MKNRTSCCRFCINFTEESGLSESRASYGHNAKFFISTNSDTKFPRRPALPFRDYPHTNGALRPAWTLFSPQLPALGTYPCRSGPGLTSRPRRAVPCGAGGARSRGSCPLLAAARSRRFPQQFPGSERSHLLPVPKTLQSECLPSVGRGWWFLFDCHLGGSTVVPEGWFCPSLCFIIWSESHVKHWILIRCVQREYPSRELRSVK